VKETFKRPKDPKRGGITGGGTSRVAKSMKGWNSISRLQSSMGNDCLGKVQRGIGGKKRKCCKKGRSGRGSTESMLWEKSETTLREKSWRVKPAEAKEGSRALLGGGNTKTPTVQREAGGK